MDELERQRRENAKKMRFAKHKAEVEEQIARISKQLMEGTPMEPDEVQRTAQAMRDSVGKRYNPETTIASPDGSKWTRGVGGALVPAMPDLLTREDWEKTERSKARYSKLSQRIWNAYRVEYDDDPQAVQAAVTQLGLNSGMSLDEISDLASDEMARPALFNRIHNAVRMVEAAGHAQLNDNRTVGIAGGGPSGGAFNGRTYDPDEEGSLSADIRDWQRKVGIRHE